MEEVIEETREEEMNSSSEEEFYYNQECNVSDEECEKTYKHIKPSLNMRSSFKLKSPIVNLNEIELY